MRACCIAGGRIGGADEGWRIAREAAQAQRLRPRRRALTDREGPPRRSARRGRGGLPDRRRRGPVGGLRSGVEGVGGGCLGGGVVGEGREAVGGVVAHAVHRPRHLPGPRAPLPLRLRRGGPAAPSDGGFSVRSHGLPTRLDRAGQAG